MARDGVTPHPPLAAVQAYADFLRFRRLPYSGGTFDQPGWLLEEMRVVHHHYTDERDKLDRKRAEKDARSRQRLGRRGRRR